MTVANYPGIHDLLAASGTPAPLSLAGWYGAPLGPEEAMHLQRLTNIGLRLNHGPPRPPHLDRALCSMVARFWLGLDVEGDYLSLRKTASSARDQALNELVYGQLLMSQRLIGAHDALEHGFHLAANLLAAKDYFQVLKRHELLAELSLSARGSPPQDLPGLLAEAVVIRRLRGKRLPIGSNDPADTVG